ncbi:MAG: alpha/beta hydrolase [Thermoleophilia bacterium]
MTTETKFLTRPDGRIAYDVTGAGPLVVCVPGMGVPRTTFREFADALAKAGNRVATMDIRGHGDSDTTFHAYDDPAAGADALALIEALGEPAAIVGNSMGAAAGVWAATQRPDLVRGLVLVGPFVRDPHTGAKAALMGAMFRAMLARPWGPAVWRGYLSKLFPGRREADFQRFRERVVDALRAPGRWRAFCATARTSHAGIAPLVARVTAPTLVVMGTADPDFPDPAAEARWVADTLHGRVEMIEAAGHYPHVEFPERTVPAVAAFLGEH